MPSAMPYTDVHRAFLQAVSQHGTMSAKQAYKALLAIYAKCKFSAPSIVNKSPEFSNKIHFISDHDGEEIPTEDQVPEVVSLINGKLHRYDQKISFVHYDPADMDFYVFCNLIESPLDRLQNNYTESELGLFRLILRELAGNEENKLKPIVCLNLTSQIQGKPLSKVRAEELLEEWEKQGYFVQLDGMWYFGPKTIGEFDRYLLSNYPDEIQRCKLCKESVFYVWIFMVRVAKEKLIIRYLLQGVKCDKCPESFHKDCMKKYLRRLTTCPGCKGLWSTPV